ncbi:hypothetical protein [Paracoccus sp. KR1-242]|uniref:hypothetical protein n=1 Tax=Paracoccus sp. KR1-242 TaxID=3410028 RepID=UPI003C06609E
MLDAAKLRAAGLPSDVVVLLVEASKTVVEGEKRLKSIAATVKVSNDLGKQIDEAVIAASGLGEAIEGASTEAAQQVVTQLTDLKTQTEEFAGQAKDAAEAVDGAVSGETTKRVAADNAVGVISLVNAVAAAPTGGATVITAEVSPAAVTAGIVVGNGSVIRLIMPSGAAGTLRLQVAGDTERAVMRERNNNALLASDVTAGVGLVLERRSGNWVLVSGSAETEKMLALQAANANASAAVGSNADLRTINLAGTGDAWTADLSSTVTGAAVTALSASASIEIHPVATNATSDVNLTIAGVSYPLRDADGIALPPAFFVIGRRYILRRRNTILRVASGDVTASGVKSSIDTATVGVMRSEEPQNTDAGLEVKSRDGEALMRVDEDGTRLAGLDEPIEDMLQMLALPVVAPTRQNGSLDTRRMMALTSASQSALAQGLAARGGRVAPLYAHQMPTETVWGKQWLSTETIYITGDTPRINIDPIYQENVANPQFVHPYVGFFPHGWLGYEYVMCINPYPGGNDQLENPFLFGSHDMLNWDLLTHLEQPLSDPSRFGDSTNFLSDNAFAYDPYTGELICFWRRHVWATSTTTYEWRSTLDGKTWSEIQVMFTISDPDDSAAAPALVFNPNDGLWYMYASTGTTMMVRTKRDIRDQSEPWSTPETTGITAWHQEARILGGDLYLFSCRVKNNSWFDVHRSVGGNWKMFEQVRLNIFNVSAFQATHGSGGNTYKNSFVPHLYADGTAQIKGLATFKPPGGAWWMHYIESARKPIIDV